MSPATPVPEIVGSAVVVSVEPLAGLVIVGAAGAAATLTVNVSVAAAEDGPPETSPVNVAPGATTTRLEALLKVRSTA